MFVWCPLICLSYTIAHDAQVPDPGIDCLSEGNAFSLAWFIAHARTVRCLLLNMQPLLTDVDLSRPA